MPLVYTSQPANLVLAALLAEGLQLAPGPYGLIVSLPFWCNMVQLVVTPTLGRWLSMKHIFVTTIWLHTACWAVLGSGLLLAPEWVKANAVPFAGGCILAAGMVASVMGVAWTAWLNKAAARRSETGGCVGAQGMGV